MVTKKEEKMGWWETDHPGREILRDGGRIRKSKVRHSVVIAVSCLASVPVLVLEVPLLGRACARGRRKNASRPNERQSARRSEKQKEGVLESPKLCQVELWEVGHQVHGEAGIQHPGRSNHEWRKG